MVHIGPAPHVVGKAGPGKKQMQDVGLRQAAQGAHMSQIAFQLLVVKGLGVPLGLAQDGGAAFLVQAHDIELMVGVPPGADPADALRQGAGGAGHPHPVATHGLEGQPHVIRQPRQDQVSDALNIAELDVTLVRLDEAKPEAEEVVSQVILGVVGPRRV